MAKIAARATNVGHTLMCAQVRGHSIFTDLPEELGGTDTAALPPESLLAALGNCIGMVVTLACNENEIECLGLTVDVEAQPDDERKQLDNFRVTITMPGDLDDAARAVVEGAFEESKVLGTVLGGADVEVTVA